jgi:hypothetical protein
MNYHRAHNDQAKGPTICTIDRFASIEFKVGKDHFEYIKSQTNWLSGVQLYSEALVLLEIPDREGSVFQVRFELMPGKSRFEFVRLLGDVSRNCGVSSLNLGPFEFESDGSNFVLNYRK